MRFNIQPATGYKSIVLLLIGMFAGIGASGMSLSGEAPPDSVGQEVVNGQTFVLYRVEPKETLYSISNNYGLSVSELVKHNPETEAGLKVGAVLRIPYETERAEAGRFHTVDKSETLYSISRRYEISVADLRAWNGLSSDAINLGDRLRISAPAAQQTTLRPNANTAFAATGDPAAGEPAASSSGAANRPQDGALDYAGKVVHTVESKETLYSIARMYDTTPEEIREWNRMTTDNLAIDQRLIVGTTKGLPGRSESDRLLRNEDQQETASSSEEYSYNKNPITITQIGDPSQEELEGSAPESPGPDAGGKVRKTTELGMAMVIDDTTSTKKYLALHRTAPVGTIMQVHNEMNNLSVFVRIVGKLPATGEHDKVLIKLSRKAFDKLGAYNEKFPVRLTYVP